VLTWCTEANFAPGADRQCRSGRDLVDGWTRSEHPFCKTTPDVISNSVRLVSKDETYGEAAIEFGESERAVSTPSDSVIHPV